MTAIERAEAIIKGTPREWDTELRDAIHRAIIEHSNADLERRRKVEARVQNASQKLASLIKWLRESGSPRAAQMAEAALTALEALDENSKPEPDMRHKRAMQESQEYAKALKALEGDDV